MLSRFPADGGCTAFKSMRHISPCIARQQRREHRMSRIGFIGFGEVVQTMAIGLRQEVPCRIFAYARRDGETIRRRAAESGLTLVPALEALCTEADILISAVTAPSALVVARQVRPWIGPRHIYADFNSVAPTVKRDIEAIMHEAEVRFVDVAVMGAITSKRHRTPMLACGSGAADLAGILAPFGMSLEVVGNQAGIASAIKMCRSLVLKGLASLFLECLLAASKFSAERKVFDGIDETFPGCRWNDMAHFLISRSAMHAQRRSDEMNEVTATLAALDIDPIMARATAQRLRWLSGFELKEHFGDREPNSYDEVLEAMKTMMGE
jgi:3-hydroxyisobutyrate dehydrogenase-like beta-hydroxyacid dehydrogenase